MQFPYTIISLICSHCILGHKSSFKPAQFHNSFTVHSFSNFFVPLRKSFIPFCKFIAREFFLFHLEHFLFAHIFCSIWKHFCSQTSSVPFETFFAPGSTSPRRTRATTTKLLLGPLRVARGQKMNNVESKENLLILFYKRFRFVQIYVNGLIEARSKVL